MAEITQKQIEACYEVGKEYYAEEIHMKDGIIKLIENYKMNKNSAEMYIQFFKYMMNNKQYTQSISRDGLRYYLNNVLNDYGKNQLIIFLQGLEKHIKYRQEEMNLPSPGFCTIHNEYSKNFDLPQKF